MSELLSESSANAENNAAVNASEVDSEGVETVGAESATAAAEAGKPEPRDKVQERFDKLTREKYEGLSRAERAEYRLQLAEQQLAELKAPAKTETVAPSDEYPTLESVGWDEDKHRAAVATWVKNQTGESVKSVLAQEREAAQREQSTKDWDRKQADFIKTKPEYADKVVAAGQRGEWACTDAMAQVIQQSAIGPEVAMYLAENANKSFEIARLPAHLQHAEIGRIEARIEAAKAAPPPVSKAPPPIERIDAGESTGSVRVDSPDADKLSDAEWSRRRNAQEQARLRRIRGG